MKVPKKRKMWQEHDLCKQILVLLLCILGIITSIPIFAQKKAGRSKLQSISSYLPYGYNQVGSTNLYYSYVGNGIDVQGYHNGSWYGSTYSNGGYKVAMQVDNGSANYVDCQYGSYIDGVRIHGTIVPQGDLARVIYSVENTNPYDVRVSLGVYADVMIGYNDSAPISRRKDTTGNTYGVTMMDGNGAQLCILNGSGLAGVTPVSDYWFGGYYTNRNPYEIVGNYYNGDYYMMENGYYDSGMGWCWKDRSIPAGSIIEFSYLIGVGEVNLEPNSSFEVTPDDPEGWNDLSRPHRLTLEGTYDSPAGLDGMIEYAVEDSEEWYQLTDMIPSGSTFTNSLVAMFDPSRERHVIRFRTRDNVGNTTLLPSIEYQDITFREFYGVKDMTYTGEPIYQDVYCDGMDASHFTTANYYNNVNSGVATFNVEGVFPYTIGRRTYNFNINPAPLTGELTLPISDFVYNGYYFYPEWSFTESKYSSLIEDRDYYVSYSNNLTPGTARITVYGRGNYTSAISKTFNIDKAPLRDDLYTVMLPPEDVTYDGTSHQASLNAVYGVGTPVFTYTSHNSSESLAEAPVQEGCYDVYMKINDGTLYYGKDKRLVGTFNIYRIDEADWNAICALNEELLRRGCPYTWNLSQGEKSVSSLQGITLSQGHVKALDLSGKNISGTFPCELLAFSALETLNISSNGMSGDIAEIVSDAVKNNTVVTDGIKTLKISDNAFEGNVGKLASCFPHLTSLNASHNSFTDVTPVISSTVSNLEISHQHLNNVVDFDLTKCSFESLLAQIPAIALYDHNRQSMRSNIQFICTNADPSTFNKYTNTEWAMQIAYLDGYLSIPYVSNQIEYYGNSGDILNVINVNSNGTIEGTTYYVKLSFEEGDANFSGTTDLLDLQSTINYMFGEYNNKPYNFTASDLWKDNVINVQDAVVLVNHLLDKTNTSLMAKSILSAPTQSECNTSVFSRSNSLCIDSDTPIAAFDIIVNSSSPLVVNPILTDYGFICSQKRVGDNVHLIGYSLSGMTLPMGENTIATMSSQGNLSVSYAQLSDIEANEVSTNVNMMPTKISEVSPNQLSEDCMIYNLNGSRVATDALKAGTVCIMKSNGNIKKVTIKK